MARPDHDRMLLTWSTLVALTPLIPLPFVDDMVKARLQRHLVAELAAGHGLKLSLEEVSTLADDATGSLKAAVKSVALSPLKLLLRKTFMVLAGKKMVELASECYHRGWMLDEVLAQGWCAPAGPHPAADVRRVIDKILRDVPVAKSPITEALKVGYDASREALQQAFDKLKARLTRLRGGVPPERVAREARDGADLGSVVDALRRALDDVPRDHFDGLRERLAARLGA